MSCGVYQLGVFLRKSFFVHSPLDLQLAMQSMPITTKVVSSNPAHSQEYSIQHYVINFVSEMRQVGGFLQQKTDHHDITEILLKVVLNTITLYAYPVM